MSRIAYSNSIPVSLQYLGFGQWALRWDVEINEGITAVEGITPYRYNEEILDHYPSLDEINRIVGNGQFDDEMTSAVRLARKMVNTAGLTHNEALRVKVLYPVWGEDGAEFGKTVEPGFMLRVKTADKDILYEVTQAHSLQADWKPGVDTASLYKVVDKEHAGTMEDPIPFVPPMELVNGKYYTESDILYLCVRDSGIPLSMSLVDLVGNYVSVVGE